MSRELLGYVDPPVLLVMQLAGSVSFLAVGLVLARSWQPVDWRFTRASLLGILEPGASYVIGLEGLARTTAGNASAIAASEPIIIVLLLWVCLGQQPSRRVVGCVGLTVAGVVLISWTDLRTLGELHVLGDGLVVLSTVFAAAYVILSSKLGRDLHPLRLAAGQQAAGLMIAALHAVSCAVSGVDVFSNRALSPTTIAYAAISGIIQYGLAFWLYLVAVRTLSVAATALWLALIPVFGLAAAVLYLGERPGMIALGGAAAIIMAAIGVQGERQPPVS